MVPGSRAPKGPRVCKEQGLTPKGNVLEGLGLPLWAKLCTGLSPHSTGQDGDSGWASKGQVDILSRKLKPKGTGTQGLPE